MSKFGRSAPRPQEPANEAPRSLSCHANGCPLRGSVDPGGGGRFFCSFHGFANPQEWPAVTERILEHDWLFGLMRDVGKADEKVWRELATRFWSGMDDKLIPKAEESRQLYLYRLHLEAGFRVGARLKQPTAIIPKRRSATGPVAIGNLLPPARP